MAYTFDGSSKDGSNIEIFTSNKKETYVWLGRIILNSKIYLVVEATSDGEFFYDGDLAVMQFDGDIKTLKGKYTYIEDRKLIDKVWAEYEKLIKEDDKKEKDPYKVSSSTDTNAKKRKVYSVFRNIFYILSCIYGCFTTLTSLSAWLSQDWESIRFTPLGIYGKFIIDAYSLNIESSFIALIIIFLTLVFVVFPVAGVITSILAFRKRKYPDDSMHNTAIVIGALCINPFSAIAGIFKMLISISKYKMYPKKDK